MNEIDATVFTEIEALRTRLEKSENILRAIQNDEVDAVVVYTERGDQVFTLKSTEHPYRHFIEKVQEGTVALAGDDTVFYCNQHFATLTGRSLDKLTGTSIFSCFLEADLPALQQLLRDCTVENTRGEFRVKRESGEPLPVYVTASRYAIDDVDGVCLIVTDRSEHMRNEEMTEKLRQSERLASIGTLATGIAHEINNPLNSILMSAQYALEIAPAEPSDLRESLGTVIEETKRCGRIVKNVLQFAKHEDMELSPCDLNAILRRAGRLAQSYTECDLKLSFDLDPDLPPVLFKPMDIEQVVVNLIRNSCDAAGSEVRVCVGSRRNGNDAEFWIADDGPGIPPENLTRIFDPFFSTRRDRGGTGLGLSIVHGIITRHRGDISVTSRPGAGTTFTVRLKLAPQQSSKAAGPS